MKHFLIRTALIVSISAISTFLSIFVVSTSTKPSAEEGAFHLEEDISNYYDAISYGTVNKTKNFSARIIHSPSLSLEINKTAKVNCKIGILSANESIYSIDEKSFSFDHDIVVEAIDFNNDGIILTYHLYKEDYIVFAGNKYDFQTILLNSRIQLANHQTTTIANKSFSNGEYVFESKHDDFSALTDESQISVIVKSVDDCYFIDNSFLTEQIEKNTYLLHIYNKYVGEQRFYDREITVQSFSNTFSIITSGNVYVYEKVLLDS